MRFVDLVTYKGNYKECGNHRKFPLTPDEPGQVCHGYRYYRTTICETFLNPDGTKEFWANGNGWGTRSTTAAVRAYRKMLVSLGYTEIISPFARA